MSFVELYEADKIKYTTIMPNTKLIKSWCVFTHIRIIYKTVFISVCFLNMGRKKIITKMDCQSIPCSLCSKEKVL